MTNLLEGFYHPAEWRKHESTWLSWPHNTDTWPSEVIVPAQKEYSAFIALLSFDEKVNINVCDEATIELIQGYLAEIEHNATNVIYHLHPTNDSWIRDHGPDFIVNDTLGAKFVLDWQYNAWGDKYPPYDLDNEIPGKVAEVLDLSDFAIEMVLEGGSVDFNGEGVVLTTEECLLNPNRNPNYDKPLIEDYLKTYFGVNTVVWLKGELTGDDTDGHIDNVARFVNENTILCAWEEDASNPNAKCLTWNYNFLKENYPQFNLIKLPMPQLYVLNGLNCPASYANFYIANNKVIVPTYGVANDERAIEIISACFPNHKTIGLSAKYLIWGQGSFHCLSKQEPAI